MCPAWDGMHQHKAALGNKALEDSTDLLQRFSSLRDKDRATDLPVHQTSNELGHTMHVRVAKET